MTNENKISFSELKIWKECPFRHKLQYIDNLPRFQGNEYTAFGTAVHTVCEKKIINESLEERGLFAEEFEKELSNLDCETDNTLVEQMRKQGS